ncbi:L-rhamnose mutarotase [Leifsonia sp. F6_8S_P_1B]|uniref:L-rhamnose mutarotase n=1 Tax=Leifsonia williamsii TaxID=3035919 RepID=A0ABT8KAW8_9MICO|nr:L-rhamnose mutarotase [Leifsonia williamsii]MDN4614554.1 L-rhamnose mutarotase [Leifsonia williamsii]
MTRTHIDGYRTRLRPGQAERYRRVHARIPEPVAAALRASGLVSWRIWVDGETLFHAIETTDGRAEMLRRMAALGPIDPEWDALIGTLVNDAPDASRPLPLVWELSEEVAGH